MPDPALHVQGLRFEHAGGAFRLEVPELRVEPGEHVLLAGGSGRGKSTLLQLVAGLRDPQAGSIEVGGVRISALAGAARDRARGRRIGMVFQTFNLLHGFTAAENLLAALMFSDLPAARHEARALELLKALGIPDPDADVDRLSVGQQQRVAVARALAPRPTLVLADEPTASLDPENAVNAVRILRDACREQGAALLIVSHDPALEAHFARRERLESLRASEGAMR